jgi:hypothetical protein
MSRNDGQIKRQACEKDGKTNRVKKPAFKGKNVGLFESKSRPFGVGWGACCFIEKNVLRLGK